MPSKYKNTGMENCLKEFCQKERSRLLSKSERKCKKKYVIKA
jgi:hypothetical protein